MRKRLKTNLPGGLIDSPAAYLQNCAGNVWRCENGYCTGGDFALCQMEYEQCGDRACQNCTPAAAVNALGYYRSRFPQIPDDPQTCYQTLRQHLRLIQSPVPLIGGYPAFLNAVMVRRMWRLLGIDAWPTVYPFPDAAMLRKQIERGEPLMLSLKSQAYRSHTVLLLGWELWTDGKTYRLLWTIRDGWQRDVRYLDADHCWIYQAIRLAR